jgi:hypothetical protein
MDVCLAGIGTIDDLFLPDSRKKNAEYADGFIGEGVW